MKAAKIPSGTGKNILYKKNGKNSILKDMVKNPIIYLMAFPAVIYFIIFSYIPMVGILLAFKRYNYTDGILFSPWVGFNNFRFLFISGTLGNITLNTITFNIAFMTCSLITEVGIAILLSEITNKLYKKVTQSMMFLPYFVSYVILAVFAYNMFNYENGLLNNVLKSLDIEPVDLYIMPSIWKYILVFFNQWKGLGYGVVIYLAAITGISEDYYEAAKIDGASRIQQIRFVTLPLLKPTIIIINLFAIGRILRGQFDLFYQIIGKNGNLYNATDIIDTFVFRMLTVNFEPGMGTAAGLYQSLFGFFLVVSVNYVVKKINPDYALF